MILLGSSKTSEGFVRVRERRAVTTAWAASSRKCFAIGDKNYQSQQELVLSYSYQT